MNANIFVPISGMMLTVSSALCMTFRKMMNMTVAMMVAAVVERAVRKAKMAIGNVAQRVKTESGVRNIETKQVQAPVRNRANIMREARRTSERASMTF